MHTTLTAAPIKRLAYAALAAALLTAAVVTGGPIWQFFVFGAAPDIALFAPGPGKGQLHPRAVPLYNALHRAAGPILLGVLAHGYLLGALAWGLHIALDRAIGYGLRARDGFQRS
jgi:hypothetical protein